jgi:hypothetical protein
MSKEIEPMMTINTTINVDDIIWGIGHDEAMYFIKNIDKQLADWDFTFDCFRYYLNEVLDGAENEPEIMAELNKMMKKRGYILQHI